MNASVLSIDIGDFVATHVVEIFSTMLGIDAVPISAPEALHFEDRITGTVGFAGNSVNGVVYLHFSARFAARIAGAMLGVNPEELGTQAEINDVVGELTNILASGLRSALCNAGARCSGSVPSIIRGTSFIVEPLADVERFELVFDCGGDRIVVEVHTRTN